MRFVLPLLLFGTLVITSLMQPPEVASSESLVTNSATVVLATTPVLPVISATAYGVFDIETGELLLSQNANTALPIASITKLFTADAILSAGVLNEPVTITAADVATLGRAGKLQAGEEYTVHELLFPLLLESSNDAATALSRVVDSIQVAGRPLADGSGLSAHNKASVTELAHEVRRLYREKQHLFDITAMTQRIGPYTGWVNNSPVRDLPDYRGGKHGYTEAAGRTLAAVFAEPSLAGRELGYVVLGSEDVRQDVILLRAAVADSVELK